MGKKSNKKEKKSKKSKRKYELANGSSVSTIEKKKHKKKKHKRENREKKKFQEGKKQAVESSGIENADSKLLIAAESSSIEKDQSNSDDESPILHRKCRPKLAFASDESSSDADNYSRLSKKERRIAASSKFKTDLRKRIEDNGASNEIRSKSLLEDTDDESDEVCNAAHKTTLGQHQGTSRTKLKERKKLGLKDADNESDKKRSKKIKQNEILAQHQTTPKKKSKATTWCSLPERESVDHNKGSPSRVLSMSCKMPNETCTHERNEILINQPPRRRSSRISKRKKDEIFRDETSSASFSGFSSDDNGEDLFDTESSSSSNHMEEQQDVLSEIEDDETENSDDNASLSKNKTKRTQKTLEPFNYAALNFQMHMADIEADESEGYAEFFSASKALTTREAFEVWLDDLAHQAEAHLRDESGYISSAKQSRAASQIERPFCTRRESTLGSSAWKEDFRKHLSNRPIYRSVLIPVRSTKQRNEAGLCDVCGRSNHNASHIVELSGPPYDAQRTWEHTREKKHADWKRCFQERATKNINIAAGYNDNSDPEDSMSQQDIEKVCFRVGNHCRARTELYHHLLHYKFRLFDLIQGRLLGNNSNVVIRSRGKTCPRSPGDQQKMVSLRRSRRVVTKLSAQQLMVNMDFVDREFRRYRILLQNAEDQWGIAAESQHALWVDGTDAPQGEALLIPDSEIHLPELKKKKNKKEKKEKKRKKKEKKKHKEAKQKKKKSRKA